MADNMYDDESSPPESEDASIGNDSNETPGEQADHAKGEEAEDQMALVPTTFFKGELKPGKRETIEIVEVFDGEVSVKCVYGDEDKDDEGGEDDDDAPSNESAPAEAEDEMMV